MNFNLFPSYPLSNDIYELRKQRISTRVFTIVLICLIYILLIYTSTTTIITVMTITHPDLQQYQRLFSKYPRTLTCPCSQISVSFDSFTLINYSRHHICNSFFVTDEWTAVFGYSGAPILFPDFRVIGRQQFQGLQSLCQLAEESIQTGLVQFYSNSYVNALTTSNELLLSQMIATIQEFISSTTSNFLLSLRKISNTTHANALLPAAMTNYRMIRINTSSFVHMDSLSYDNNCSCSSSSACTSSAFIYTSDDFLSKWYVPGFYIGCFILETLRQSRLECLYNATCLNQLRSHLSSTVSTNLVPLDPALLKRFTPQTLIGVIVDALMVEEWHWSISHDDYYNACKPKECSYTLNARKGAISIVTMLLGLIGGLVTALKIVVPRLTAIVFKCIGRYKTNVVYISTDPAVKGLEHSHDINVEDVEQ